MPFWGNLSWQKERRNLLLRFRAFWFFGHIVVLILAGWTKSGLRWIIDTAKYQVQYCYSILHVMFITKYRRREFGKTNKFLSIFGLQASEVRSLIKKSSLLAKFGLRNECYNYSPAQTHFRVRPQVWVVTQRLMNFQWHFAAVSLQSCCPCDVFESNPCSKMNVISQVLCTTDFDTFKKLSTQSKVSRVYYHLPTRREISKRKFASPRGHVTSLSHSCEILDCIFIPFTSYMLNNNK